MYTKLPDNAVQGINAFSILPFTDAGRLAITSMPEVTSGKATDDKLDFDRLDMLVSTTLVC